MSRHEFPVLPFLTPLFPFLQSHVPVLPLLRALFTAGVSRCPRRFQGSSTPLRHPSELHQSSPRLVPVVEKDARYAPPLDSPSASVARYLQVAGRLRKARTRSAFFSSSPFLLSGRETRLPLALLFLSLAWSPRSSPLAGRGCFAS